MKFRQLYNILFRATPYTIVLFPLLFANGAAAQTCIPKQSSSINFSEFPLGTSINSQYLANGVVFSGSGPRIVEDFTNPTSPVLSGTPQWFGDIVVTFVNPNDITETFFASDVAVSAGNYDTIGAGAIDWVGLNGTGRFLNTQFGSQRFVFTDRIESFRIHLIAADLGGYAIDNLAFTVGADVDIVSPVIDDVFPFVTNNVRSTQDITFLAENQNMSGNVKWDLEFLYMTTLGNRGLTNFSVKFNGKVGQADQKSFTAKGGRVTVTAAIPQGNNDPEACSLEFVYMVGNQIPDADITARLNSLYSGATPNLLTGLAQQESSYRQFETISHLGISAKWPLESVDGGSHVGLMGVPITYDDAWDWHDNTSQGDKIFGDKLRSASRLERRIRNNFSGLRALDPIEHENMALTLYGEFAMVGLDKQYYRAEIQNGVPVWVVNTLNNPNGVNYANSVRSKVR